VRLPVTPTAAYLLVLGWASLPFVPAEPMLVGAGSYAATGALALPLVVGMAASGSLASDLAKYALGRACGPALLRLLRRREPGARAVAWIETRARRIGPAVIVPSYFVPFGVVAATLLCGVLGMRLGPVAAASVVGAALWSSMFVLLGYAGGAVMHDPLTGALLALPVGIGLAMLLSRLATARTPG
jgi:membrane protein DedA with SNARE-associated domain